MESELSPELAAKLREHGLTLDDEVSLRRLLDESVPSWTLIRLNTIAAKRWKARYRLMLGEKCYLESMIMYQMSHQDKEHLLRRSMSIKIGVSKQGDI